MQKITLSEKQWAVGLWWQPLASLPRKQVHELSEQSPDGQEHPYNVFATLRARKQIGIGRTEDVKTVAGIPSLAAGLARVFDQHGNVLALFRFNNGMSWLFAVKDGQILPGGDLYDDDETVLDTFRRYAQSNAWKQTIKTEGTKESEQKIYECLNALNRPIPRLRPVSRGMWLNGFIAALQARPKQTLIVGAGILLFVAASIGIYQVMAYHAQQDQQAKLAAQRALLQQKLQKEKKGLSEIRTKLFPPHWQKEPEALQVVRGCYAQLEDRPYQIKGWTLAEVICEPRQIRIVRQRSNWASFTNLPAGAELLQKDPNKAAIKTELRLENRQDQNLTTRQNVSANLYELAGILNSPVEITWSKPEPRTISEQDRRKNRKLPEQVASPYWIGSFKLIEAPESFIRKAFGFNKIPGLTISQVRLNDKSWSIEGVVYAK